MKYTKKTLIKLLEDNNITTITKSIAELLLIALDNIVITREDVLRPKKEPKPEVEKKPCGRPRKYPPKEVDPNKVVDPKYERLLKIRNNPRKVTLTNVETGEIRTYDSLYKAVEATGHGCGYFLRNKEKTVNGIKIEVSK